MTLSDQMFQKYQPKIAPLNPFEETEEDNYTSPTTEHPDDLNPFKEHLETEADRGKVSTNPFEDSSELDEGNPFSDKFEDDSYSSLERQKKKKAPTPPRSKSQTLPNKSQPPNQPQKDTPLKPERKSEPIPKSEEKVKAPEKVHRYIKSPKKKAPAPGPPRPMYEGTPPSSPKEQRKSRSLTPPTSGVKEKPERESSVPSTPSSV